MPILGVVPGVLLLCVISWGQPYLNSLFHQGRSAFEILTNAFTGKRPLGRSMHRWGDNIRMDPEEIGIGYEEFS